MSASLAVLAVLDFHISNMTLARQQTQRDELIDTRVVIAGLIEAAQRVCASWPDTAEVCGLREALAIAKGEQP